jgi:hypothetical protein
MDLIRVVPAILPPPLGVFLQVGLGSRFWLAIRLAFSATFRASSMRFKSSPSDGAGSDSSLSGGRRDRPSSKQEREPLKAGPRFDVDEARLQRLDAFADLLDARFRVPGTGWRFGLDSIVGLVPGVGDVATAAVALWVLWQSHRLGASKGILARMAGNVVVDAVFGSVPLVGDIFDATFKSNRRNVALLRRHLGRTKKPGNHA